MAQTIAILRRRDSNGNWNTADPIVPNGQLAFTLSAGEFGTPLIKMGNGVDTWSNLPYLSRKNNLFSTSNPATGNNASEFYSVGSMWLNRSTPELFVLTSFSGSDAVWTSTGGLIPNLSNIADVPPYPDDGYSYVLTEEDGVLSWAIPSAAAGAVDSVNGQVGIVVLDLEDIDDVPPYPNDGYEYVLTELDGALSWEIPASGGITEQDVTDTRRAYTASQQIEETALAIVGGEVDIDFATVTNAMTLDLSGNAEFKNPTGILSGAAVESRVRVVSTGAGGWDLTFDTDYIVDADELSALDTTTGQVFMLYFSSRPGETWVTIREE